MSFKVKDVGRFSAIFKTYIFRDKNNQNCNQNDLELKLTKKPKSQLGTIKNNQKWQKMVKNGKKCHCQVQND